MTLDWQEAVEKYAHDWKQELGGFWCPVTKQVVQHCYTDHSKGGYDEGEFRIVCFNTCNACGDPDYTVAGALRELNERRKKEEPI